MFAISQYMSEKSDGSRFGTRLVVDLYGAGAAIKHQPYTLYILLDFWKIQLYNPFI